MAELRHVRTLLSAGSSPDDGDVFMIGGAVGIGLASVVAMRLLLVGLVLYLERRGHALGDIAQVVRAMGRRR